MTQLVLWSSLDKGEFGYPIRPRGCYQIAAWLRQFGFEVKVIEFCHLMSTDDLVAITEKHISEGTRAIGVSSTFWSRTAKPLEPAWVYAARKRLSHHGNLSWLLGGSKAGISTAFPWIRFQGYAEDEILAWMQKRPVLKRFDVNKIDHSYVSSDLVHPSETLTLEMGRGCIFKCRFCNFPLLGKQKGTYVRNMDTVREELIKNYNEFGTTSYFITDDTVNEDEDKIRDLARIAQGLQFELKWVGFNRLDLIATRQGAASALKDSGLVSTFFGIESFGTEAAKSVGKPWNSKHARTALLRLKDEWPTINWQASFIVGLPGDTEESLHETVDWCIENEMPDWIFYPLSLSTKPTNAWKSEFETNHQEYGYSFAENKLTAGSDHWIRGDWDWPKALEVTRTLNARSSSHLHFSAWSVLELTTLGYDHREIIKTKRETFDYETAAQRSRAFVQHYVDRSLERVNGLCSFDN